MKNLIVLFSLFGVLLFVKPLYGATNSTVSSELTNIAKTNLNMVLVDILSGVRSAGSEVYGASKHAINSSLEFVQKETPEVIEQFLKWRLLRHACIVIAFIILMVCCFLTFRHCDKNEHEDPSGFLWIGKYVFRILFVGFLIFGVGCNVMEIGKILVAPKVYMIEYVIDTVTSLNH